MAVPRSDVWVCRGAFAIERQTLDYMRLIFHSVMHRMIRGGSDLSAGHYFELQQLVRRDFKIRTLCESTFRSTDDKSYEFRLELGNGREITGRFHA